MALSVFSLCKKKKRVSKLPFIVLLFHYHPSFVCRRSSAASACFRRVSSRHESSQQHRYCSDFSWRLCFFFVLCILKHSLTAVSFCTGKEVSCTYSMRPVFCSPAWGRARVHVWNPRQGIEMVLLVLLYSVKSDKEHINCPPRPTYTPVNVFLRTLRRNHSTRKCIPLFTVYICEDNVHRCSKWQTKQHPLFFPPASISRPLILFPPLVCPSVTGGGRWLAAVDFSS